MKGGRVREDPTDRHKEESGNDVRTLSVVIATRNRQALLALTLDALAAQDWPAEAVEIVVADNGSTDATAQVVAAAARRRGRH